MEPRSAVGRIGLLLIIGITFGGFPVTFCQSQNLGVKIGILETKKHGVRGTLYAADDTHLILDEFGYDGEGQDTYFWVGTTDRVGTKDGTPLEYFPYPKGGVPVKIKQEPYFEQRIRIRLPVGKTIKSYKYFSIYCRNLEVDFGSLKISPSQQLPKPRNVGPFIVTNGVSSVKSGNVVLMDSQTMLIQGFTYDGSHPSDVVLVIGKKEQGVGGIRIPNENRKVEPLGKYANKNIKLTLPGNGEFADPSFEIIGIYTATTVLATLELPKDLSNLPVKLDGELPRILLIAPTANPRLLGPNVNGTATRNTPILNYIGLFSHITVTLLTMGFVVGLHYA